MNTSTKLDKSDPNHLKQLKKEVKKEKLRRKVLLKQQRMQEVLLSAIDNYWEVMSEEERRAAIKLGRLSKNLEENLKKAFTQEKN